MKIPYGTSDFGQIRAEGLFYADKTPFIEVLERPEVGLRHVVFLRPRRFGKSTLVSMLEHYYDLRHEERYDELFGGLWIHAHPTAERHRYLVLTLDFSKLTTSSDPAVLSENFCESVKGSVRTFCMRYRDRIPELAAMYDELNEYRDAAALMSNLVGIVAGKEYKMYVLVDEYDHFANRLLASGAHDVYEAVVRDTGFARSFFATLKAGTGQGAVARMFITGVSPLLLDDLSSGFNIATLISTSRRFNTLAGFTRADVERAVGEFLAARPELAGQAEIGDRGRLMAVLEAYYNGYRFSPDASERVFNSDMVLYFFRELDDLGRFPDDMLDMNVRTEYRHLQRIGALGGAASAERRALLERILSEGHIQSDLVRQFGVKSLPSHAPYVSLLYYMGMLTLRESARTSLGYDMEIPNRVIRALQWEHLALMLQEQTDIDVNLDSLGAALAAMAVQGDIQPFLDLFHERVLKKLGVKDMRGLNEKALKLMLVTYLSLSHVFHVLSEKEFAQGYCDLFLGASRGASDARFSWLLELKYLPTAAKPAQIEAAFAEARQQVERYTSDGDLLPLLLGNRELRAGMLVFVGVKRVLFRAWPAPADAPPAPRTRKKPAPSKKPAPAKRPATHRSPRRRTA